MTDVLNLLKSHSQNEPFAKILNLQVQEVSEGSATVTMSVTPEMKNIFGATHGGALFGLIDEAFQLACNSHGTLSVALNVSITYVAPPDLESTLQATAKEIYKTRRTASYQCEIRQLPEHKLIATANGIAYRTGKSIHLV